MKRKISRCLLIVGLFMVFSHGPTLASGYQPTDGSNAPTLYHWTKTWGGSSADNVGGMAADDQGNLYVVGSFTGTADFDPDPNKTDSHTSNNGSIDAYISKFDANGVFLWAQTWGGDLRDVAYGVGVDRFGNAYVVGPYRNTVDFNPNLAVEETYTSNAGSENNIYLSKFAPDGTFQWVRTWGPSLIPGRSSFGAEAYHVEVAGDYLYVVGDFSGDLTDFNPWGSHDWHENHKPDTGIIFFDAFLSKFDLDGNFIWAKTWGGEGYDDGPGVAVDGSGNVYVAGMYASVNINFDPAGGSGGLGHPAHDSGILVDVFLSKFDSNGVFQWVRTWGGQGTDEATGIVALDSMNNVYVTGRFACAATAPCDFDPGAGTDLHSTGSPLGKFNAFLSKLDANGNFQWARTWGAVGDDEATGLAVYGAGEVYVAGRFHDTVDFDPGSGVDTHTSNGQYDMYLNQLDADGNFQGVRTWGGSGDDFSGVAVDRVGNLYTLGNFAASVDFDPGASVDTHAAVGGNDAYISKFFRTQWMYHLPLVSK